MSVDKISVDEISVNKMILDEKSKYVMTVME
jgi:hypothetical protein